MVYIYIYIYIHYYWFSGSFSLLGAVGIEYSVEMTYPLSEGISASLINVATMVLSISACVICDMIYVHIPVVLWNSNDNNNWTASKTWLSHV